MCDEPEYLTIPWFLRRNPTEVRKRMNKIKKALDTLSKTDNPIIKSDMIKVLREQFIHLQNSFNASCNHNEELITDIEEINMKLTPRLWTKEMYDAWHGNLPDTMEAFEALKNVNT